MCDKHDVIVPLDQLMQLSRSSEATAQQLADMVQQLGVYLVQLGYAAAAAGGNAAKAADHQQRAISADACRDSPPRI